MAGLGNPLSFELGGGPSPQEQVYGAMYQNVGDGIQAPPDTLVEKWRMARARGIAAFTLDDRAATQAFPDLSTDYLPVWEDILSIQPDPAATEQERRETVLTQYTRVIDATYPKLLSALQDLDSLFSILLIPTQFTRTTAPGRAFQDWDPAAPGASGPPFNLGVGPVGDKATAFPNYSDDFVLFVLFNVGAGAISVSNQRTLADAIGLLNESLPAWVDFRVFSSCGFVLDQDLLDVTAMCDGIVL